ncbi:MAG: hypothetical protein ACI4TJ_06520, partial [Candidatus Cryptobacteroides sp.]
KDIMNERDIEYQQGICFNRGLEQGLEQGRAEGREEGRQEGRQEGRAEGRQEGARENAVKTARALLQNGVSTDIVANCTGLSLDELEALGL